MIAPIGRGHPALTQIYKEILSELVRISLGMSIKTTREKTDNVSPMEKFDILAADIDQLRLQVEQINGQKSVDDLLELIELADLAQQFGSTEKELRKRLRNVGGEIFKLGKIWVIRKIKLLQVYEAFEKGAS